jgi:hypothetical protein
MLRGVGAGRGSSSCTSGPERPARIIHHRPRLQPRQDPTSAARASSPVPRGKPGTQQDAPVGSRSRSLHLPLDSSLTVTPTNLALVSSERLCPRDRGTPTRAQHRESTPTLGAPGARHPDDCTTDQAGGVWGGWPPPDQTLAPGRPGSTGPRSGTGPEGPAQWNAGTQG